MAAAGRVEYPTCRGDEDKGSPSQRWS